MKRLGLASALAFALLACGCTGWTTAAGGPVYSVSGRQGRTGGQASVDAVLTPKPHTFFNKGSSALPVGYHNGFETLLTPDLKSFGWQTGLALFWKPRPVSGFIILGTDLHFDGVDGYFSFGNFQPYGQIGIAASLGEGEHAPIFTLTGQGEYFVHYLSYLHDNEPHTDAFIAIKLGFGFEQ